MTITTKNKPTCQLPKLTHEITRINFHIFHFTAIYKYPVHPLRTCINNFHKSESQHLFLMDVINEETTPYQNQIVLDFVDHLPPGYRFYPTDSELIVDYLNVKIQSKENPRCCRPMHEVNIYCHKPEELAGQIHPYIHRS